jgi:fructose-1,6-bisphosphatase/inositol monophosphatase family enzyme
MTLTASEITAIIGLLRDVSAAEILPRFKHLGAADIRTKSGPLDPVTVADEAAEKALAAGLKALFPETDIIGEEAVAAEPGLLQRLGQPGPVWVIDPIDGTANFAADLPLFGVMLALVEEEKILAGFIHDPFGDDTAVAIAGGGAWIQARDGSRKTLRTAAAVPIGQMTGALSWRFLKEPLKSRVVSRMSRLAASFDLRCAAHQYRMIAAGHCHMMLFRKTLPWDHCAGVLLFTEAGGYAARYDGTAYLPSDTSGGLLLAPDRASWEALHMLLLEG